MNEKVISRRTFLKRAGLTMVALSGICIPVGSAAADSIEQPVPYSTGTERPRIKVPPNATDCHHHIYDSRFPIDAKSALRHPDATVADYRLLQKRLGTTRNVIVQPSTYGVDNSGLIESLDQFGLETTRGIAVVNTSVTESELENLNAAGVRGIRFNLSQPGGATNMDMVLPLSERIKALGWHIQIVATADQILAGSDVWRRVTCPVVFDHLGHVPSVYHPAFDVIVMLLQQGNTWVKLSGAYILSKVGPPTYDDRADIAKSYIKVAPDKMLWGSDWPHPTSKPGNKPNDAILLDLLADWIPDEATIHRILVDNPAKLYGFS
ncbi:MAG: amidohydrolase family protein [Negativicutes bacterium]|nr:amidohydrolase family protein [Negativicutes bacterium]